MNQALRVDTKEISYQTGGGKTINWIIVLGFLFSPTKDRD